MLADYFLVSGSLLVLTLSVGQLLVTRKQTTNRVLFSLFTVSFLWIAHGISYRFGLIDRLPHLNKVYLPLLCITGSLWFTYIRSVHNEAGTTPFARRYFLAPAMCIVLSIPFYLQTVDYKRAYIGTALVDTPSILMYAATRLAELTLVWYIAKSILYLHRIPVHRKSGEKISISQILYMLSIGALVATVMRLIGAIIGDQTISVLYPCLFALAIFAVMHLLSYRNPVVLSLANSSRIIKSTTDGQHKLASISNQIQDNQWYLDPNLKIQSVARRVSMPQGELSSLINTAKGMNYNEYINEFRICHAKRLLLDDISKTALSVAHDSGYNSKSAFYKHFTNTTSMSPIAFREANIAKSN